MSYSDKDGALPRTSTQRASVPGEDQYLEDGPLFRATVKGLESRTSDFKANLKRILESASASLEAKRVWLEADKGFIGTLRESLMTQPLFPTYMDDAWEQMLDQRERLQHSMQSLLVDPLRKLYEQDIKSAETKRRKFEDESKDYYAYLSKYLSITKDNKKRMENETKHKAKKHRFDLARFDYYAFLVDLHGGKKEKEVQFHLLSYQQKEYAFYQTMATSLDPLKQGLDRLAFNMAEASREQDQVNKERIEKRRWLEAKYVETGVSGPDASPPPLIFGRQSFDSAYYRAGSAPMTTTASASAPLPHSPGSTTSPCIGLGVQELEGNKFRGFRDLEPIDHDTASTSGRRKEGFLFSPITYLKSHALEMVSATWHKNWCVLSGGQLHEYNNWKRQLESHNDPINLRFATVREARNSERRFCFEIITPQFQRIYQATSNEEMMSWITTINNAIMSMLSGMNSSVDLLSTEPETSQSTKRTNGRSLSNALRHGLRKRASGPSQITPTEGAELLIAATSSPTERFRWSSIHLGSSPSKQFAPPLSNASPDADLTAVTNSMKDAKLLELLRADKSNLQCADCEVPNPEWCSLNLGILLCISCSGTHRSFGTHVSKIRSLTLDNTSYTPHIVALLRSIGNARSNAVWAPTPTTRSSTDTRDSYIKAKYVDREFRMPSLRTSEELLFEAIDKDDIPGALYAVALGANLNAVQHTTWVLRDDISEEDAHMSAPPMLSISQTLESIHTVASEPEPEETHNSFSTNDMERSALHFALLHSRRDDQGTKVFPMAEFLLLNGADAGIVDDTTGHTLTDLIGMDPCMDDDAIEYLNLKNTARGQSLVQRTSLPPSPPTQASHPRLSIGSSLSSTHV